MLVISRKQYLFLPYQWSSNREDGAFATEAVDSGLIPGQVKPKTIKIGITTFLLDV